MLYFHVIVPLPWSLIASNICYEGKNSGAGTFQFHKNGEITSLKLVHVSGLISCHYGNPNYGKGIWTCFDNTRSLSTVITNQNNEIIFPPGITLAKWHENIRYADRTKFKMTESSLIYYGPSLNVSPQTTLMIWNIEDLGGNYYDGDNGGRHCVDVYGQYFR